MIWPAVAILILCWIVGLALHSVGISIHVLLIAAIGLALIEVLRLRKKALPNNPAPFFLTEFEILATWDFPDGFDVKDWPGLLLCHIIDQGTSDARFLAWWDSKASYNDYWAAHFKARLRLTDPVFQGAMVRHKLVEEKWWEKVKSPIGLYSIFISLVALVTAITQFKTFVDWASAFPDTTLAAKEGSDRPIVVTVGEQSTLTVEASNNISSDSEIELSEPDISTEPNEGHLTIAENHPQRRKLAASSPIEIAYHLTVGAPGEYEVRFHGTQHSGQLFGWQPIHSDLKFKIDAWPQVDEHPAIQYERSTPEGIAVYSVVAKHGHPLQGSVFSYQAVIAGEDLGFVSVNSGTIKKNTSHNGVAVIVWEAMPSIQSPLTPQQFELTVKSNIKRDENYWKDPARQLAVGAK